MEVDISYVQDFINKHYQEEHNELIVTKRIIDRLSPVVLAGLEGVKKECYSLKSLEPEIETFLEKESILKFIEERQPVITKVSDEVLADINEYFSEHLAEYSVKTVFRKSNHPDDTYMYSIVGQDTKGNYACWSSWNESLQSLNHGHYDLKTKASAEQILIEHFNDITDEKEKYGMEQSRTEVNTNQEIQENKEDQKKIVAYRHKVVR